MLDVSYVNKVYPMPMQSLNIFLSIAERVSFKKGNLIFEEQKVEKYIYIIQKGVARAYKTYNETEVTFWFGIEGDTIISIKNYVENKKSYESIEAIEDIIAYRIETEVLKALYTTNVHFANWGRCYSEKEMLKNEERLISRQFKSASERYQELITTQPEIIKRVALGHIASYLGITQVSLSRIRADLR